MYGGPPGRRPHGCGSRLCRLGGFMTRRVLALSATALAAFLGGPAIAQADVVGTGFETSTYQVGDIDGQGDWSKTGPYDVNIQKISSFPDAAGYGFGSQAAPCPNAAVRRHIGRPKFFA